jgi:hypothetical protein
MHPVIAAAIPGAARIIAAPIIANTERDNADAQLRAEFDDRYAAALIVVVQIIAVDPATIPFPIDIAPGPVVDTAVEIQ